MAISPYIARIREKIGNARLLVPSVAAIIYGPKGEILLVQQSDGGVWSTPGGSIEPDEAPIDAVVREAWEETGLLVRPVELIGVYGGPAFIIMYPNGDETQYVAAVYECAVEAGELIDSSDEVVDCRYVSAEEFDSLDVSPWTREVLPGCYARRKS